MPHFNNQRRCLKGQHNINSLLIVYSVSSELVLCKYASISLARGTLTLLKTLIFLVQRQWLCARALNSFIPSSGTGLLPLGFGGAEIQWTELEHVHLGLLSSLKSPIRGLDSCWACSDCWASPDHNQGSGAEEKISVRWLFADFCVTDTICYGKWQNQNVNPQGGRLWNNVQNLIK